MKLEKIWICFFHPMNKLILIILINTSCNPGSIDKEWDIKINLTFKNQSSHIIRTEPAVNNSDFQCNIPNILQQETYEYSFVQKYFSSKSSVKKPSIDGINFFNKIYCSFFYGNSSKCSRKIRYAKNYINGTKINDYEFSFTYVFTEEEYNQAEDCE